MFASITAQSIGSISRNTNAIYINTTGTFNITCSGDIAGHVTGNSFGAVSCNSSATINITCAGQIYGGNAYAYGVYNGSIGTINLTGSVTGGASGGSGAYNNSTGTINITGNAIAGSVTQAAQNFSTGTLRVTRAIGNGFGLGSTGISNVAAVVSSASGSLTYVEQLQFGSLGNTPVSGPIRLTDNTGNVVQMVTTTGSIKTLVDTAATSGILPAVTDVRTGVTYSSGNRTGTCAVPAAGSVALGVAVDNTTGTAVLTAANVRTAVGLASANLDTQLATAAADSSGTTTLLSRLTATRAGNLDNVDATVSSRLASASYSTAPTAAAIRSEMDANSTKLANLDATVSSRSTYAGGDTSGTTTLLSRLTSTRASAIDNLDATISSRLATSGYTTPPTAAAIRSEIDTNSTKLDVNVGSRLAPSGTLARVTLVDTTTTLSTAPVVPSVAQITAGVWGQSLSGLTTAGTIGAQLATNADVPVSTRLAAASYTTPPTTAAIRTELSVELARIDAAISSRSTYSGADTSGTTTLLGRLTSGRASNLDLIDVASSTRLAASNYTTPPTVSAIVAAIDKTGYSLTDAERQAISTVVQQGILNENDGEAILNAIVGAIGNQNVDTIALVAAIRADLERSGGTLATRLAASSYTTPPTAAAIRSEIDANSTKLDVAVSSRLAPSGTLARCTLVDTATTLTNAPTVPTPAQIATATRSELAPELARVANCATVDTTGQQIQDALDNA